MSEYLSSWRASRIRQIVKLYECGTSTQELSNRFGLTMDEVLAIIRHLPKRKEQ
jgi:Mor family transcriptional regulator